MVFAFWSPLYSVNSCRAYRWLDTAYSYLDVREHGYNRSPEIDRFNRYVGNPLGASYCAAFAGYCKNQGGASWKYLSGLAQNYFRKALKGTRYTAQDVIAGRYKPVRGDLVIWGKGNTINGHIGFVWIDWVGISGLTIEANTSPSSSGSQADGEGIYIKKRTIKQYDYFRIIGFVHLEGT